MTCASPNDPAEAARVAALKIVRALNDAGHVAYFAGGCVRDALLKLVPKDYDVATSATPVEVKNIFRNAHAVGAAFGVMLVPHGPVRIEVATFRTDGHYADGRRPESVQFSTPQEDAQRRDFTLNGLFYDPIADRVIDYVDGQADLARGVVRAIGDASRRFAEDYLRMLRGVRFAARFGFIIDPDTGAAITYNAPNLAKIASERVTDELRHMLGAPTRAAAIQHLWSLGLIDVICSPIFQPSPSATQSPKHSSTHSPSQSPTQSPTPSATPSATPSLIRSPTLSLHLPSSTDFSTALLAVLMDYRGAAAPTDALSPGVIAELIGFARRSLKLSNDELAVMQDVARWAHALFATDPLPIALLRRFVARPTCDATRALLIAIGANGSTQAVARIDTALALVAHLPIAPAPFVTGDDLVAAGFFPGRAFKTVLEEVYDRQLEDALRSRDEAFAFACDRLKQHVS